MWNYSELQTRIIWVVECIRWTYNAQTWHDEKTTLRISFCDRCASVQHGNPAFICSNSPIASFYFKRQNWHFERCPPSSWCKASQDCCSVPSDLPCTVNRRNGRQMFWCLVSGKSVFFNLTVAPQLNFLMLLTTGRGYRSRNLVMAPTQINPLIHWKANAVFRGQHWLFRIEVVKNSFQHAKCD